MRMNWCSAPLDVEPITQTGGRNLRTPLEACRRLWAKLADKFSKKISSLGRLSTGHRSDCYIRSNRTGRRGVHTIFSPMGLLRSRSRSGPFLFPEAVSRGCFAVSRGENREVLGKRSPREIRARGGAATPRWFLVAPARCETSANRRHSADSPTVGPHIARLGLKKPIGSVVLPSVDRSASTSPITGANLNPCPLKPQAIATFACAGCSPTTKFESADIV